MTDATPKRSGQTYLRRASQAAFFVCFAAFVTWPAEFSWGELFFWVDVVSIGIASAAGFVLSAVLLSAALVIITFVRGRVFCGYACPLGAIADLIAAIARVQPRAKALISTKYHALIVFVCLAVAGFSIVWLLAPLGWAARTTAIVSVNLVEPQWILATLTVFVGLELLLGRRGFCRVLCPLGALLGLVARTGLLDRKVSDACTNCGACYRECPTCGVPAQNKPFDLGECFRCGACESTCKEQAIAFRHQWKPKLAGEVSPPRRRYLFSLAVGAAAATCGRVFIDPVPKTKTLRPPGSVPEDRLHTSVFAAAPVSAYAPPRPSSPASVLRPAWRHSPRSSFPGRVVACMTALPAAPSVQQMQSRTFA